jgi:hypothetical protein
MADGHDQTEPPWFSSKVTRHRLIGNGATSGPVGVQIARSRQMHSWVRAPKGDDWRQLTRNSIVAGTRR